MARDYIQHAMLNTVHPGQNMHMPYETLKVLIRTPRIRLADTKGLSTCEAGRGHATPNMPVETAKCWWLLKIEPNVWAGGKGSCVVCVVGTL